MTYTVSSGTLNSTIPYRPCRSSSSYVFSKRMSYFTL